MTSRSRKSNKVRIPIQDRSIEKKLQILNTAYALFSKMKYPDVNIRMIAEKSGVSIGTIYSYFKDKQEIFNEIALLYNKEIYNNLFEALKNKIRKSDSLEESIYKIIIELSDGLGAHLNIHKEIVIQSMTDVKIRKKYLNNEAESSESIIMLFNNLFKDKININYDTTTIFVVRKIIEEFIQFVLFFNVEIDKERVFRELSGIIAFYLQNYKK